MAERLKRVSSRHRALGGFFFCALVIAGSVIALGLTLGRPAVLIAMSAWALLVALNAQFGLWRPFESRPTLDLRLYRDGESFSELLLQSEATIRPIDRHAIVNGLSEQAKDTIEPRPEPVMLRTDMLREKYDDALSRFNRELEEWSREMGAWLLTYESRRWPSASYVEAWVLVANEGDAPAEDLAVEIALPPHLQRTGEPPASDPPPEPPKFFRRAFTGPVMPPPLARMSPQRRSEPDLGPIAGPDWILENDRPIARYRAAKLLHGTSAVSAHPLRFIAKEAGRYEMKWTVRAANLREPATGIFVIDARRLPRSDEPARSLRDVIETAKVPIRWDRD